MNNDIKIKTFNSLFWRFAERCGAQGVTFLVSIILARLLDPSAYGTIALVSVFVTILQVFVDSGMGNALIQKKDADDLDFSSVFYFNVLLCIIIYIVFYFISPLIANFYGDDSLTIILRVLGLTIIISGLKNVQQAYISKHLMFKKFFFSSLGGTLGSAVIGISLAYLGYGIWALVFQQIINLLFSTIILWLTVEWKPKLKFSFNRVKKLYSFGWKLLVSSIIDTLYNNLQQLIVGKVYSSSDLAFYNQGKQFPSLIVNNINASIDSVLLPVISNEQDNKDKVKSMTRRAIKISSYIMWPLMIGLLVVAEPLVRVILTEKWLPCVPFLRVFCLSFAFYPIHTANLNAIKAMGRSDYFLRLEIVKKIVGLFVLLITMQISVYAIAFGLLITALTSSFINSYPNKELMNYSYVEQIRDILPFILLATIMGIIIYPISFLNINQIVILVLQVSIGAICYIVGSKLLKFDSYQYLMNILLSYVKRH